MRKSFPAQPIIKLNAQILGYDIVLQKGLRSPSG